MIYEAHETANIFPMMSDDEYKSLVEDIRSHGLLDPIWLHENKILDGRNRYRACLDTGIIPVFRNWNGECGTPLDFVISQNMHRRHLTSSQRAIVALEIERILATENEISRRQKISEFRRTGETVEIFQPSQRSSEKAAGVVGTNSHYINDAKRINEQAPDLIPEILAGRMGITEAKRELKERQREDVRIQNRLLVAETPPIDTVTPGATYQTLVLDPPWDWGDEGDVDQFGRARPTYNTMSIEEIAALPVGKLADSDAHIYLWITNRSLPKGFGLLERWGFRYITMLTWVKPYFGMGNYFRGSTEQVLFGVRGSLPLLRNDARTHFLAPRPGEHSAKPDEFYQLVETCSPGPWLEMFARKQRNGWVSWGAEI